MTWRGELQSEKTKASVSLQFPTPLSRWQVLYLVTLKKKITDKLIQSELNTLSKHITVLACQTPQQHVHFKRGSEALFINIPAFCGGPANATSSMIKHLLCQLTLPQSTLYNCINLCLIHPHAFSETQNMTKLRPSPFGFVLGNLWTFFAASVLKRYFYKTTTTQAKWVSPHAAVPLKVTTLTLMSISTSSSDLPIFSCHCL